MIRVALSVAGGILRSGLESIIRNEPSLELVEAGADVLLVSGSEWDAGEPAFDGGGPAAVVIAADAEPGALRSALRSGARAVLPAQATPTEIVAAIQAAAAGLAAVRAADLESLWNPGRAGPDEGPGALSPRELEILRMLAEGLANKEIAWRLGISEHTAKFHVASILNRLDAGSRAQAVAIGIRRGLILI